MRYFREASSVPSGALVLALFALILSSCSPAWFRKKADAEVSGILEEKSSQVPGLDKESLGLKESAPIDLEKFPRQQGAGDFLGPDSAKESGARRISLRDALAMAITHNRDYLAQKESVYLGALSLTLQRHQFTPIFSAGAGGRAGGQSAVEIRDGVERIVRTSTFTTSGNTGVDVLTRSGMRLASDLTADFLQFLVGGLNSASSSRLAATLAQPILRGGGYYVTMENLTQAERNLLYSLRDFVIYRQDFVIRIVSGYYRILQARDAAKNNYLSYTSYQKVAEMNRALAGEGRQTSTELGQIEQALLRSESSWIRSRTTYFQLLDSFKITLGLPVEQAVILDDNELSRLTIKDLTMNPEKAMEVALATRLDLLTEKERHVDTARQIKVAENGLLPGLDFTASFEIVNRPTNGVPELDWRRTKWSTGLQLDAPLDRKSERNNYRASLIDHERSGRSLELAFDEVKLNVLDRFREMDEARRQYEIAEAGVNLAERRLEEEQLLDELGRGTTRDLVDSQNDLTSALNQKTSAVVTHTIARLQFWKDLGLLAIDNQGGWVEPLTNEGL